MQTVAISATRSWAGPLVFIVVFGWAAASQGKDHLPASDRRGEPAPAMLGDYTDEYEQRATFRTGRAIEALLAEEWDEAYRWLDFGVADVRWMAAALQRAADRPVAQREQFHFRLLHFYLQQFDLTNCDCDPKQIAFIDQCLEQYAALVNTMPEEIRQSALDVSHRQLLPKDVINHNTPAVELNMLMADAAAVLRDQPGCLPAIVAYLRASKVHYRANGERPSDLCAMAQTLSGSFAKVAFARAMGHFPRYHCNPLEDQLAHEVIALSPPDLPWLLARRLSRHDVAHDPVQEGEALALAERIYSTWPGTIPANLAASEAIALAARQDQPADALRVLRRMQLVHPPEDHLILQVAGLCRTARQPEPEACCWLLAEFMLGRPGSLHVPQAMMLVAEICSDRGDLPGKRAWLEAAIRWTSASEDADGRLNANRYRMAANHQLALFLEAQGDWAGALHRWEQFDASYLCDCGTGIEQAKQVRQRHIAGCLKALSPQPVALAPGSANNPAGTAGDAPWMGRSTIVSLVAGVLLLAAGWYAFRRRCISRGVR